MIELQGKYKFEQFHVEIENPTLVVRLDDGVNADIANKQISVVIELSTDNAKCYGIVLDKIDVDSFAFDTQNQNDMSILLGRIVNRLNDFKL